MQNARAETSVPRLSVLMPVFNASKHLDNAISSILKQTFTDFEFLIIDDGSTDSSLAIIRRFAALDGRIKVVSRENRGLVNTLNEGLRLAEGEWIARMDADDQALPHRFEKQLCFALKHDLDIVGSGVRCMGSSTQRWRYPCSMAGVGAQLLFSTPFAHPSVIGKRSTFLALMYDEKFVHCEDYDLWQRAWSTGFKLGNVSEVLLKYRLHDQQVSQVFEAEQAERARQVRERQWHQCIKKNKELYVLVPLVLDALDSKAAELRPILPLLLQTLKDGGGERKRVLMLNYFKMFVKAAAKERGVLGLWFTLESSSGVRRWSRSVTLIACSKLKIGPDGVLFLLFRSFINVFRK